MRDPLQWVSTGVKPLSANRMHLGRKTDSAEYRKYKAELLRRLPDLEVPSGLLRIRLLVCVSSKLADLDNVLKPFLDTLQARYGFNDRDIYRIVAQKKIVKKGQESILFALDEWQPSPEELEENPDHARQEECPECGKSVGSTKKSSSSTP